MTRLVAHHDPDEACIIRVPDGWRMGRDFEPRIESLVLATDDGIGVPIEVGEPVQIYWGQKAIDLDGRTGCWLMAWIEFDTDSPAGLITAALDPTIPKHFKIVLIHSLSASGHIDRSNYTELVTPGVAVCLSKQD